MGWTPEELAAMAAADDEIEREFDEDPDEAIRRGYRERYRERHREEIRERNRAYSRAHPEKVAARHRAYYREHREKYAALSRENYRRKMRERPTGEFGARLKAARKRRGLSARKLAEMVGVPVNTVYSSEYGIRATPDERLAAWLEKEEENNVRMDRVPDA